MTALRKIYAGPSEKKGRQIFPGYLPGSETGPGGWGLWITGAASGKGLQHTFGVHFFTDMFYQDAAWDYRTFDFDREMKSVDKKTAQIFNATDPNLKSFKEHGGKLLLYHGWSDAAIAPTNTVNYYRSVIAKMGQKEADSFVRLYMAPGVQHCGGGPGPNVFGATVSGEKDPQHSMYRALERWVEQKQAPDQIIATKYKQGANPSSGVARTRPLCPYPQAARYKGFGQHGRRSQFCLCRRKVNGSRHI